MILCNKSIYWFIGIYVLYISQNVVILVVWCWMINKQKKKKTSSKNVNLTRNLSTYI